MNPMRLFHVVCTLAIIGGSANAFAQMSTPPASEAEKEALYTDAIESRASNIISALSITNTAKSTTVHDLVINYYRTLRSRDALIDAQLKAENKEINFANREERVRDESKVLHQAFIARLSEVLTPEQVETVKNRMTYDKVKVTYNAYCAIVPSLTDADKAKIMDELKKAREEAIDGGSASEKSEIFKKYKDGINQFLSSRGIDMEKATKEWEAKQGNATKTADASK